MICSESNFMVYVKKYFNELMEWKKENYYLNQLIEETKATNNAMDNQSEFL